MEPVCHRCGATVHGSDPFCPHCGAPQLRYEAPEEQAPTPSAAPTQRLSARDFSTIHWRDAIRAAAILALPTGVLSSLLGLEALWVIAGSMAVIALYRKRTGTLPTSGMGWRIGVVMGLFAAVVAATADGITLVVQRYAMHQGALLDQRYHELARQLTDQIARSNPQAASVLPGFLHFWLTPDGTAAMVLINAAGLAVSMLIFGAAGGALGARLTARTAHQPSAR